MLSSFSTYTQLGLRRDRARAARAVGWEYGGWRRPAGRRFPRGGERPDRTTRARGRKNPPPDGPPRARAHMGAVTRDFVAHGAATNRRRRFAGGLRTLRWARTGSARSLPRPPGRGDRRLLFREETFVGGAAAGWPPDPSPSTHSSAAGRALPGPAPCLHAGSGHGAAVSRALWVGRANL